LGLVLSFILVLNYDRLKYHRVKIQFRSTAMKLLFLIYS